MRYESLWYTNEKVKEENKMEIHGNPTNDWRMRTPSDVSSFTSYLHDVIIYYILNDVIIYDIHILTILYSTDNTNFEVGVQDEVVEITPRSL